MDMELNATQRHAMTMPINDCLGWFLMAH